LPLTPGRTLPDVQAADRLVEVDDVDDALLVVIEDTTGSVVVVVSVELLLPLRLLVGVLRLLL
jgi:hypothetical protein